LPQFIRTHCLQKMIPILTALILVWFTGNAVAAEDVQWFEVELIVFSYTSPTGTADERWPVDPGVPPLQDAIVLQPARKPALRNGPDGRPEFAAIDAAIAHRFVQLSTPAVPPQADTTLPATPAGTDSAPPPPTTTRTVKVQVYPEPFEMIDEKSLRLAGTLRSLRRSTAYQTLLHVGWLQPGSVKDGKVYLSAGGAAPDKSLEGTVQVNLSRFLHLGVDLVLNTPVTSAPSAPVSAVANVDVDDPTLPAAPATRFRLTESRRMRSQELHYFDHPKFGVVAQITPYQLPVIEMSVPAPPAATPPTAASPAASDAPSASSPGSKR
jgi:hypothetical protein